jgi:hypothetical protein
MLHHATMTHGAASQPGDLETAGVKPGARSEDNDGEAGAAGVRLTSTTLAEDDGGAAAGEQRDTVFTAADDVQTDEDGAEARPLPRHLPKPTTTSAQGAAGVQPGAHGRRRRRQWRREGCHVQLGGHLHDT